MIPTIKKSEEQCGLLGLLLYTNLWFQYFFDFKKRALHRQYSSNHLLSASGLGQHPFRTTDECNDKIQKYDVGNLGKRRNQQRQQEKDSEELLVKEIYVTLPGEIDR